MRERHAAGTARVGVLSSRELLLVGTALYAGEGTKRDGSVGFANSDARMVQMFLYWLRSCFAIDESRLRLTLYLHQGLDLLVANHHWSAATGIPLAQFRKLYRALPDPSIRRSKHPMGCASVVYSSSAIHREIVGMRDALLSSSPAALGCGSTPTQPGTDPG